MQQRIRALELAVHQSDVELTGLRRQALVLRGQVSELATTLHSTEESLETARTQLLEERVMRENLGRKLSNADERVRTLTKQVEQLQDQSTTHPIPPVLPTGKDELGGSGQP
jgi:chromosome segregation ATPase